MPKLLKTSEIASLLGVSSQTIRNTVSKLDLSPDLGKKGVFLFNADQVAAIAESLDKSDRLDLKEDPREQETKQDKGCTEGHSQGAIKGKFTHNGGKNTKIR